MNTNPYGFDDDGLNEPCDTDPTPKYTALHMAAVTPRDQFGHFLVGYITPARPDARHNTERMRFEVRFLALAVGRAGKKPVKVDDHAICFVPTLAEGKCYLRWVRMFRSKQTKLDFHEFMEHVSD